MNSIISITIIGIFLNTSGLFKSVDIGESVPDFTALDENGSEWTLSDHYRHDYIVLYFYPIAFTGGCTAQACSYRDQNEEFKKLNAFVAGVSGDEHETLSLFKEQHDLNFTLLSDPDGKIAGIFDVPFGDGGSIDREIGGQSLTLNRGVTTSRWTVVVDGRGKLIYRDNDVKAAEDSKTVLEFLSEHKSRKSCAVN